MQAAEFAHGQLLGSGGDEVPWPDLALFGDPVAHSLSPRLHAAALAARGIEARYAAVRVSIGDLSDALAAALAAGTRGLNLTVPLKERGFAEASRATDECRRIAAANTMVLRSGGWMAHNTDARGLAMALERALSAGMSAQLRHCMIIGSGGSARAAASALQALGAAKITVAARSEERARWCTGFGAVFEPLADVEPGSATLLVNCTPVGLEPDHAPPVDPTRLDPDAYVLDLTYADRPSRLLAGFSGRGQDGRAMLVAQAALAFSAWYGALPPLAEMASAIGIDW